MRKTLGFMVAILSLFFISAAIHGEGDTLNVSLRSHLDDENVVEHDDINASLGNTLSFDGHLIDNDDYQFAFWIVNGHVRHDFNMNHEFTIRSSMNLEAVFTPTDKYVVLFMDTNGEVLKTSYVNENGDATPPDTESLPDKPGYVVAEDIWDASYTNVLENKILTIQYEADDSGFHHVTVINGEGDGTYAYNETITVTAEGEDFAYWIRGNTIVSYERDHTFTVMDDLTLEAVFKTDFEKPDTPFVSISDALSLRDNYSSYVGQFFVPDDHTLVEYGMIASEDKDYIDFDTDEIKRMIGEKHVGSTNEFLMSFPQEGALTRAYLITKDSDGALHKTLSPYGPVLLEEKHETFSNFEGSGATYVSETFMGDSGVEWTVEDARKSLGGYDIDDGGIMVRVPGSIEGSLNNGLGSLSIDIRMGFTGGSPEDRTIEIYANNELIGSHTLSDETDVETLSIDDLTLTGNVDLRIQAAGVDGRQIVLNNLVFEGYYASGIHHHDEDVDVSSLMIYEIYPGGGNSGAIYNQSFVILYNPTQAAINLDGKSIQYASSSGSFNNIASLEDTIYPETFYVIGLSGGSQGVDLPVPLNMSASINPAMAGGKIAIASTMDSIDGPDDERVLDFVGYGSADQYLGDSAAPRGYSDTSIRRVSSVDTRDNGEDFEQRTVNLDYVADHMEVVDITVSNPRRFYELDEAFDVANTRLVKHYNNGTRESVPLDESMVENFDTSEYGSFTYDVVYDTLNTEVAYEVIDYEDIDAIEVHYIDVGRDASPGDAMLIKIGNIEMLVDAGNNTSSDIENLLDFLDDHVNDGTIEYLLPSHPHADHIGGYEAVFDNYEIGTVFQYCYEDYGTATSDTFEALVDSLPEDDVRFVCDLFNDDEIYAYDVVPGVTLEFYDTGYLTTGSANEASVVFTLDALGTRLFFSGDAYKAQEEDIIPLVGNIDILKLGHHGSRTSTSQAFIDATQPDVGIILTNILGNTYNHPHIEAIEAFYSAGGDLYSVSGGNSFDNDVDYMHQRNGHITVTIDADGYTITSEFYGENPLELKDTDYYQDLTKSASTYDQTLMHTHKPYPTRWAQ